MKLVLVFLLASAQFGYGQMNSSGAHRTNGSSGKADTTRNTDIRERLVQLAMQNPNYEIADRQVLIASYQIKIAKSQWLTVFIAQANINEFTINPHSQGQQPNGTYNTIYYPRYNFGINVPFDVFARIPAQVKMARENYYMFQAQKNEKYRLIREQVLTTYEDYLLAKQTLEFQIQIAQDEYTLYRRAEKDYSDGIIKLEDYDKAYRTWTVEQIKKLTYQRDLNVIKLNLEHQIGVKIDDLVQQSKP